MTTVAELFHAEAPVTSLPCYGKGWLWFGTDPASERAAVLGCRRCPMLCRCADRIARLEAEAGTVLPGVWAATTMADRRRASEPFARTTVGLTE